MPDKISDIGFRPPAVAPIALVLGFGLLAALMMVALKWRNHFDGWRPIPDVKYDHVKYDYAESNGVSYE